jgi:hypothetical protein
MKPFPIRRPRHWKTSGVATTIMGGCKMKLFTLAAILASMTFVAPLGRAQNKHDRLIAHVEHEDLSFSIAIDPADDRFLAIDIPQKPAPTPRHLCQLFISKS